MGLFFSGSCWHPWPSFCPGICPHACFRGGLTFTHKSAFTPDFS